MMTMDSRSAVGMELCAISGCVGLFAAAMAVSLLEQSLCVRGGASLVLFWSGALAAWRIGKLAKTATVNREE